MQRFNLLLATALVAVLSAGLAQRLGLEKYWRDAGVGPDYRRAWVTASDASCLA